MSDFSFSLYGKPQKTRKYIMKSQRIISKRDFSKILHKSTILISSYNPIYDVLNLDGVSNEFIGEYSPVRFFTPNEIETLRKFYGDPTFSHDYFKKDRIENISSNKNEIIITGFIFTKQFMIFDMHEEIL